MTNPILPQVAHHAKILVEGPHHRFASHGVSRQTLLDHQVWSNQSGQGVGVGGGVHGTTASGGPGAKCVSRRCPLTDLNATNVVGSCTGEMIGTPGGQVSIEA